MKKIIIPAFALFFLNAHTQTIQTNPVPGEYEKFISREGSLILSSNESIFESGSLDKSLEISYVEAKDVTRKGETIRSVNVTVNKSKAYLSKEEVNRLVNQMKKIQLLLVDGEISKKHTATFNIRNTLLFEVFYNDSKRVWKYRMGVVNDGRKRLKEVTSTEFQDIKISLENQLSRL